MLHCLKFETATTICELFLACDKIGNVIAAIIDTIAITTINSIRVKALDFMVLEVAGQLDCQPSDLMVTNRRKKECPHRLDTLDNSAKDSPDVLVWCNNPLALHRRCNYLRRSHCNSTTQCYCSHDDLQKIQHSHAGYRGTKYW
jgi:hypothetical protein